MVFAGVTELMEGFSLPDVLAYSFGIIYGVWVEVQTCKQTGSP